MSNEEKRRAPVRLIKRQQRDPRTQPPPDSPPAPSEARANRALASTVSSWVEEFRLRRQGEAAALMRFRLLADGNG
jgi:hypothetical protein